ncbi:S-adenosyl-L-methionine-dependent methyltransferase [Chytriomyces sp. MP71]|nr:S-adenosyl-L-methionine-dependent methyltransferase [Chytriomyces sp. MP71]
MSVHDSSALLGRQYKSEVSIDIGSNKAEKPPLVTGTGRLLYASQSEPTFSHRKPHPLLDDLENGPHSYAELLFGAETLENIAAEGAYAGATMRRYKEGKIQQGALGREMTDRILRMVYGTMKYLPYIDTILVKTQFLVYNNQFLNHLGLVKVMMFDLMKCHFDLQIFPGVDYAAAHSEMEEQRAEIVKDLEDSLRHFQVKMAAAFARVRIERRASGTTAQEMLENILPEDVREKEHLAVEMPKMVRINFLKTNKNQVAEELRLAGFKVRLTKPTEFYTFPTDADDCITVDDMFSDFLVIPTALFSDIKSSPILTEGKLIFQDKASAYGIRHLTTLIAETDKIIDTRAGCGINSSYLASLMKNKGKVFAFESRPSRIQSLKLRLENQRVKNVEVIEDDFVASDAMDPKFSEVTTIIIEPPNSGTAIVDKLGYLLQEEEFPNDMQSQKDISSLRRRQTNMLKHAFTFPSVNTILFVTRTLNGEENEATVNEFLDMNKEDWELNCVLPDIIVTRDYDWEIEDCLKIKPTNTGNGVFVACFTRIVTSESESEADTAAQDLANLALNDADKKGPLKRKKKKKTKAAADAPAPGKRHSFKKMNSESRDSLLSLSGPGAAKLPKSLEVSVNRLSVPRKPSFLIDDERVAPVRRVRKVAILRHDSKGLQDEEAEVETEEEEQERKERQAALDMDISIFGVSLKKFYEPRVHAIREIKIQHIEPAVPNRWRYPVPNPRPWK